MRTWLTRHPKVAPAAMLAALCALLGAWLLQPSSPPGVALTRMSYDSYYAWFDLTDGTPSDAPVLIVYLDLESHLREGQDPTKPWPRRLHAQLLHRLRAAAARAVVFDIVFDAPGADPESDQALADALRAQGSSILAGEMSVSSQSTAQGPWGRATRLAPPLELFRNAAAGWGLGEVGVDDDFVARRHYHGPYPKVDALPSLTWAAARVLNLPSVNASNSPAIPRWFRYYGPPFTLPHVGFSQALDSESVEDSVFRNKIVLVGVRAIAGLF